MKFNRLTAVLKKQLKDTIKNKAVLIQFVMFPLLTVIMTGTVKVPDMPQNMFTILFATMYIGMAPLTSMSSIISEEKETGTLRVLVMSNVTAQEYLFGTGIYILVLCLLGSAVFGVVAGLKVVSFIRFMLVMAVGIVISTLIGAGIGIWTNNQMSAASITVPVMMVFSFLPMISMFNDKVAVVSRFTYSQQLSDLISHVDNMALSAETAGILTVNLAFVLALFVYAYRKRGIVA